MIGSTPPRRPNARRWAEFGSWRRRGGGFDVSLRIEKAYFQSSNQTLLHLRVVEIVHQPGHRRSKRAHRTDDADAVVLRSKVLPDGERFRVRTADISEGGVAFVTEL